MINQFWRTPSEWPNDTPEYVFLARGFEKIAAGLFGDRWAKEEDSFVVKGAFLQITDESHKLKEEEELRELEIDDFEQEQVQREIWRNMWLAVGDIIARNCFTGVFTSGLRKIRGGVIKPLEPEMWNGENLRYRFYRCQMCRRSPLKNSPFPTHWIFLERKSLENHLAGQCYNTNAMETPIHMSPYLRFMQKVTEVMHITPDHQPKKELVKKTISDLWHGEKPCSKAEIEWMATFIREPDSKLGRAKKQKPKST